MAARKKNHVKAAFWTEDGGKFEIDGPIQSPASFAAWIVLTTPEPDEKTAEGRALSRYIGAMEAFRRRLDKI